MTLITQLVSYLTRLCTEGWLRAAPLVYKQETCRHDNTAVYMLKKQGLICIKTLSASGSVSVKRSVRLTQSRSLTLVSPAKERIDSGSK